MHIELAAFVYRLCSTESVSVRKVLLIALSVKGYFYTALQRIQRQYCHILCKRPIPVSDEVQLKMSEIRHDPLFLVSEYCLKRGYSGTHDGLSHLGRKRKRFSDTVIEGFLQTGLCQIMRSKDIVRNIITGL